nr:zinc finger, CCHC-type [Tanacetum cinerariifolium]
MYDVPRGPLPPVVIREPVSGKYQPLPELPGKGKEKVIEEQVARDLLNLQTPKKKSPADRYIFQRRTSTPTGSSGHDKSSSLYAELGFTDNEEESEEDVPGADVEGQGKGYAGPDPGACDEGHAGSNLNEQAEDQAGPDLGNAEVSQPMPSPVVHARSDRFTATAYPKVQENLKLTVEEQVRLEEPASSSGTLSSLQHLTKDLSFGDLFFSDKPSEADNDKATAETESESMVSVTIQQDMSLILPMKTLLTDLTSRHESPKRLDIHRERLHTLEKLDIPHQVSKAINEVVTDAVDWAMQAPLQNRFRDLSKANMKEILHQRLWETDSYKSHEDHMQLYKALEKSMNHDHSEELVKDLVEAHKKKKKSRESIKMPHGSPPHQPPPPPPLSFDDEDIGNAHISKVNLRQVWWKPLEEEIPATPEPTWSIPSSDVPVLTNNWASALAFNYSPPPEDSLLVSLKPPTTQRQEDSYYCRQPMDQTFGYQQRVEDFHLGIESYQTQLDLTKHRWDATGIEYKHDYIVIDSPRVVMFQDRYGVRMIMRFNEIHKFSDGTLWQIDEALDYQVKEFKINRMNPGLNTRFWTKKDVDRSKAFMFAIQKWLKTRRIFCNLESFIGGRVKDGDYRLLKLYSSLRSLKPKCTIEFRAKRSSKIISIGHYSIMLASSHTVKMKMELLLEPTSNKLLVANELTDAFGKPFEETQFISVLLEVTPDLATRAIVTPLSSSKGTTWFLFDSTPSGRTAKLRNDILIFQQNQGESLSEAWTHFKDLLQKGPYHGINLWLQVQILYDHINEDLKKTIDYTAEGQLGKLSAEKAWATIEKLAQYEDERWDDPVILEEGIFDYELRNHEQKSQEHKRTIIHPQEVSLEETVRRFRVFKNGVHQMHHDALARHPIHPEYVIYWGHLQHSLLACQVPKECKGKELDFRGVFVTRIARSFGFLTNEMSPTIEEDNEAGEEVGREAANEGAGGSAVMYWNTSQGDWKEAQANWMYNHTVREFQYLSTRDNIWIPWVHTSRVTFDEKNLGSS